MKEVSDFLVDNMMIIVPDEKIAIFVMLLLIFLFFYFFAMLSKRISRNRQIIKKILADIQKKNQLNMDGREYFIIANKFRFLTGLNKTEALTVVNLTEFDSHKDNTKKLLSGVKNLIVVTTKECLEELVAGDFFDEITQNDCRIFFNCPALREGIYNFARRNNLRVVAEIPEPHNQFQFGDI